MIFWQYKYLFFKYFFCIYIYPFAVNQALSFEFSWFNFITEIFPFFSLQKISKKNIKLRSQNQEKSNFPTNFKIKLKFGNIEFPKYKKNIIFYLFQIFGSYSIKAEQFLFLQKIAYFKFKLKII